MKLYPLLVILFVLLYGACTADELPMRTDTECDGDTPTYTQDIRPIIEASCAYSGCHLDTAPGTYDSYAGLLPNLESGIFRERVIDLRTDDVLGMPPAFSPEGRPKSLTPDELDLVECWLAAGYPE